MKGWIKKLVTGLSAVAMTVGMMGGSTVPAVAAGSDSSSGQKTVEYNWEVQNGPFNLTIDNAHDGHSYEAYQIFSGTVNKGTNKTDSSDVQWMLTDIKAGENLNINSLEDAKNFLADANDYFGGEVEEGGETQAIPQPFSDMYDKYVTNERTATFDKETFVSELIHDIDSYSYSAGTNTYTFLNDSVSAEALAQLFGKHISTPAKYTSFTKREDTNHSGRYQYTAQVKGGYYLIIDKDNSQNNPKGDDGSGTDNRNSAYTYILLRVAGNVTAEPKEGVPTVEKKVWSTNDKLSSTGESGTTPSSGTWSDWATYGNSGTDSDKIYFKITGTLPDQIENRKQNSDIGDQYLYFTTYTFTDTFAPGISPTTTTTDGKTTLSDLKVWYSPTDVNDTAADLDDKTYTSAADAEGNYKFYDMTDLFDVTYTAATAPSGQNSQGTDGKIVVSLKSGVDLAGIFKYQDGKVVQGSETDDDMMLLSKDGKIIVTYTAQLNDNAVVGQKGNLNTVNLTYTNNPNDGKGSNTGVTPDDKVSVMTFKVQPKKYKEGVKAGNELANAVFTIFGDNSGKINTNAVLGQGVSSATTDSVGQVDFYKTNSVYKNGSTTEFSIVSQAKGTDGTVTSSIADGSKPLTLGAGTYWIRESKAPDGYNKLDDLKVVIDASGNITMDDPATVNQSSGTDNITVTAKAGSDNANVSSAGLITFNIINKSGALLPSTGGIGTTIFYIVGGVVIAAAVVLLVVRKKRE